jgi:hypothetical protein
VQEVPSKVLQLKNLLRSVAAARPASMLQGRLPQTAVVVGGPKRPVHVVKGRPTWRRDEAASTGAEAPAGGRVEAPAAERDEKQTDHEAPAHASFWTAGPSP